MQKPTAEILKMQQQLELMNEQLSALMMRPASADLADTDDMEQAKRQYATALQSGKSEEQARAALEKAIDRNTEHRRNTDRERALHSAQIEAVRSQIETMQQALDSEIQATYKRRLAVVLKTRAALADEYHTAAVKLAGIYTRLTALDLIAARLDRATDGERISNFVRQQHSKMIPDHRLNIPGLYTKSGPWKNLDPHEGIPAVVSCQWDNQVDAAIEAEEAALV